MKKKITGSVLVLIFLIGLSLLLYPSVSNYWNELHQSRAISNYAESISSVNPEKYEQLWLDAGAYNKMITDGYIGYELTPEQEEMYCHLLQIDDSGVIGYIDIPAINCTLPIYLGTDEETLQVALGHIPWSSIPIGGEGTHSVISGHRGLPSARLFTDLDLLVPGDRFTIHVLNDMLTYEVDQINIVLPEEVNFIKAEPTGDYCTLLTCTPYGVNTHRLLVRGHRVENDPGKSSLHIVSEAMQINNKLIAAILFAATAGILAIIYFVRLGSADKKKNKQSPLYKKLKDKSKREEERI